MDIFGIVSAWSVGAIESNPGTPKLKTRQIGDFLFQFQVQDYKARTRMGMALIGQAEKFKGLIAAGLKASAAGDKKKAVTTPAEKKKADEARAALAAEFLPDLLTRLAEPDFADLIDEFCGKASVCLDGAKFESLVQPHVAEKVFGDDLTLQIPVAMTVAEVNLSDGFFNRLAGVFGSIK